MHLDAPVVGSVAEFIRVASGDPSPTATARPR